MAERWREFLSIWERYIAEPLEYREIDSERVLVVLRHRGRAITSGIEIEQALSEAVALFHVHQGNVVRLTIYGQRENAFIDLGLEA
jgi:hypothetical protein